MTKQDFIEAFDLYANSFTESEIFSLSQPCLTKNEFIKLLTNYDIIKEDD